MEAGDHFREFLRHVDFLQRFSGKIIGRVIWILMLQEAVKTSNESNENPMPSYRVQGILLLEEEKNLWNSPSLIATLSMKRNMMRSQIQRVRLFPSVDTNPQNVAFDTQTCWKWSNRYGETLHGWSKEEHKTDFGISWLSHSVVKEAEHIRVPELF